MMAHDFSTEVLRPVFESTVEQRHADDERGIPDDGTDDGGLRERDESGP